MKFDMHCHTKAGSIDSKISIEEYISLLKKQGFDGMLVTDHDSYKGYKYWEENKSKIDEDFVVLAGIEYDTKDAGHFIVIMPDGVFLKPLQVRGMTLATLIELVHKFGGVLGPAHPFGARGSSMMFINKMRRDPYVMAKFDFMEGFNTCETERTNRVAQMLARNYNKQCIGGSDSHKDEYVGMAFTEFDRDIKSNNDLIACIKDEGIAAFGGTERTFLRKHKKRNSFYATWAFILYNRSLGYLYTPYRRAKIRNLALHQR